MTTAWRYWRAYIAGDTGGGGIQCTEFKLFVDGVDQVGSGTGSASTQFLGFPPSKAFDNDNATSWATSSFGGGHYPEWLQYDFGGGSEKAINSASWSNVNVSPAARSPSSLIIQASEDGDVWINVYATGALSWSTDEVKTWTFTPPVAIPGGATLAGAMAALAVYRADPIDRLGVFAAYATYVGPKARITRDSTSAAYVVYEMNPNNIPRQSTYAAYVVYTESHGAEARTRAWTYTLDGHTFYVLDLGEEGTFAYDMTTSQWARFQTSGYDGWNIRAGTMWGEDNRIVGGDTLYFTVWELDPDTFTDDGFRDIEHIATGGVMTRSRVFHSVEELRIAGSLGFFTSAANTVLRLRFSDDNGVTWTTMPDPVVESGVPNEVVWRSLGSFMAPGRVFELSDIGGMFRIDGADVYIANFDEDGA